MADRIETRTLGTGLIEQSTPITLMIAADDIAQILAPGVGADEGIGLLRTDALFGGRSVEPTLEEQIAWYEKAFNRMADRRIVVCTIDGGCADVDPAVKSSGSDARGWRMDSIDHGIVRRQLNAIAIAAAASEAVVCVTAPGVSTSTGARDFAWRARSLGLRRVGVMLNTPLAAVMADHILAEVDFGLLDIDDLTHRVTAIARNDIQLSQASWHPAVLRLVRHAIGHAQALSRPLGVCGEAVNDERYAAVLVGLGAHSLTVRAGALRGLRGLLAGIDRAACLAAAEAALAADSSGGAMLAADDILRDAGVPVPASA
jgi:phosphotransferase system enzyme I (PtsI)